MSETSPVTVSPEPADGERVRFVTIEYSSSRRPAEVLNAVSAAGLAYRGLSRIMRIEVDPNLEVIGLLPGSITFQDTHV